MLDEAIVISLIQGRHNFMIIIIMSNLLIAESEPELREAMSSFLMDAGHTTFSAENGREALEIFNGMGSEFWQALVAAFELPYLNGAELIKEVRKQSSAHPIKIVLVTSEKTDSEIVRLLKQEGVVQVLSKPCILSTLLDVIDSDKPELGKITVVT